MNTAFVIAIHIIAVIIILIIVGILIYFVYLYSDCDTQRRNLEVQLREAITELEKSRELPVPLVAFIREFTTDSGGVYVTFDATGTNVLTRDTNNNVILQPRSSSNQNQLWRVGNSSGQLTISTNDGSLFWTSPSPLASGSLITLTANASQYQLDSDANNQSYLEPFLVQSQGNPIMLGKPKPKNNFYDSEDSDFADDDCPPSEDDKFVLTARVATTTLSQVKLSLLNFADCDCDANPITLYAFQPTPI